MSDRSTLFLSPRVRPLGCMPEGREAAAIAARDKSCIREPGYTIAAARRKDPAKAIHVDPADSQGIKDAAMRIVIEAGWPDDGTTPKSTKTYLPLQTMQALTEICCERLQDATTRGLIIWALPLKNGQQVAHIYNRVNRAWAAAEDKPWSDTRQCQSNSFTRAGLAVSRCRNAALPGKTRCSLHIGWTTAKMRNTGRATKNPLPMSYAKHLKGTLADRMNEFLTGSSRQEQLRLYEEIALARATFSGNLALCSAVLENPKTDLEARGKAQACIMEGLSQIADLVRVMAGIEKDLDDKVSVAHISFFCDQITNAVYATLGGSPEGCVQAEKIAAYIKEKMRVPHRRSLPENMPDKGLVTLDESGKVLTPGADETEFGTLEPRMEVFL